LQKIIEFSSPLKGYIPEPKPSLQFIPEAYKKMPLDIKKDSVQSTVKRCIPFLDAMTSGYIVPFQTDIEYIYDEKNNLIYFSINGSIPSQLSELIDVKDHDSIQITKELMSSKRTLDKVFKFNNSWKIKTPSGYSCLFVTPSNHSLPFELITGVVDTDSYEFPVNLPFYWTANPRRNFLLKQGSPMAMIIPFKREEWKIKTNVSPDPNQKSEYLRKLSYFSKIVDNYKKLAWKKKSYK